MKTKRILCPVDYSEPSLDALQFAVSLARESDALLYVLNVEDAPIPSGAAGFAYVPEAPASDGASTLATSVPGLSGVNVEYHTVRGFPSDEIAAFVKRHDVELVVMGTHGRRGLARMLMGSTAEAVVRWAQCPVLTVKTPAEKPARKPAH